MTCAIRQQSTRVCSPNGQKWIRARRARNQCLALYSVPLDPGPARRTGHGPTVLTSTSGNALWYSIRCYPGLSMDLSVYNSLLRRCDAGTEQHFVFPDEELVLSAAELVKKVDSIAAGMQALD